MIEFTCGCAQKKHRAPLEGYDISQGAIEKIPAILKDYHRLIAIMYQMLLEETDDEHLKRLITRYLPYFNAVEEFCIKMKVPPTVTDRQEILDGIHRALIMRDRYTILFYLRDHGKFEEYANRATDLLLERL